MSYHHHEYSSSSKRGIHGLPSNSEAKNSKLALIAVSIVCGAGLALLGYLWFAKGKSGGGGGKDKDRAGRTKKPHQKK